MRIDMHCHIIGNGNDMSNVDNDVYLGVDDNQHWFTRILYNLVEKDLAGMEADLNRDGKISTKEYIELLYSMLITSEEIDGIVLLGLDAVYSRKAGRLNKRKTDLWVSNKFLANKVEELNERIRNDPDTNKRNKRFYT